MHKDADAQWNRWRAGLAVARSSGDGSFGASGGLGAGALSSTLTAVHPYVRFAAGERLSAWGVLGYGARGVFVRADSGLQLAARLDARMTRMGSEAVSGGEAVNLAGTAADTRRLRFLLEGTKTFALGSARALTPSLELGLRQDGGDAETGAGVEAGGTLRYLDTALGLSVEASARTLLAHQDEAYRGWGRGSKRLPETCACDFPLTANVQRCREPGLWVVIDLRPDRPGTGPDGPRRWTCQ